jgi:hypothetical protein
VGGGDNAVPSQATAGDGAAGHGGEGEPGLSRRR